MIFALAAALSVVMGITLGLLGGGGSILTVPILRYALEMPAREAIAASLLVVGTTAAVGVVPHARSGNVVWRTGFIFAGFAMTGAYAGGFIAQFIAGPVLLTMFGGLMLVTGFAMLRKRKRGDQAEVLEPASPGAERVPSAPPVKPPRQVVAWWLVGLEGLVVGLVTGMVGAGGGFLVVPALVLLGRLDMVEAVGTSLLVIAMKSFAGFAGYATHVNVDWALVGMVSAAAAVGTIGGARLARHVDPDHLRKGFAYFVFVMAAVIIYQEGIVPYGEVIADVGWQVWAVVLAIGMGAIAAVAWLWRAVVARRPAT